jgi:hypothetical protein
VLVARGASVDRHAVNGHLAEVEIDDAQVVAQHLDRDLRLGSRDLAQVFFEAERDFVMQRPPAFDEPFAPLGQRGRGEQRDEEQDGEGRAPRREHYGMRRAPRTP